MIYLIKFIDEENHNYFWSKFQNNGHISMQYPLLEFISLKSARCFIKLMKNNEIYIKCHDCNLILNTSKIIDKDAI